MKAKIIAIAMGLSLALSAACANEVLFIEEIGENLFARLNGHESSFVTITPNIHNPEAWDIVFSMGWSLNPDKFQIGFGNEELGEPKDHFHINELFFASTTKFTWISEVPHDFTDLTNRALITDAIFGPSGEKLDLVRVDVPEPSSTLSFLGIGLAALAGFARLQRTAM